MELVAERAALRAEYRIELATNTEFVLRLVKQYGNDESTWPAEPLAEYWAQRDLLNRKASAILRLDSQITA